MWVEGGRPRDLGCPLGSPSAHILPTSHLCGIRPGLPPPANCFLLHPLHCPVSLNVFYQAPCMIRNLPRLHRPKGHNQFLSLVIEAPHNLHNPLCPSHPLTLPSTLTVLQPRPLLPQPRKPLE